MYVSVCVHVCVFVFSGEKCPFPALLPGNTGLHENSVCT